MIGSYVKGKTAVFIDAANIFYSQRTLKWKISYTKLKSYFEKECQLTKVFIYTATDIERQNQSKFIAMLQRNGFIVRTKPVK